MNYAIILGAGKGKRMGAKKNKIFLEIEKKPMIYWTLLNFEQNPKIDKILFVAAKNDIKKAKKILKQYNFKKILDVIRGGPERQDSSYAALKYLKKIGIDDEDIVLIHNGANPYIDNNLIFKILLAIKKVGAAVCGFPVQDTIKEVKGRFVVKTLDRKKLWQIQTPQGAKFKILWQAYQKAYQDKFFGTDDAVLIERLNKKVKIVESPRGNIKVTYPDDLDYVKLKIKMLLHRKKFTN